MIWALLFMYFFGSSGTSALNEALAHAKSVIKEDVQDTTRRAELIAIVDAAEKAAKDEASSRGTVVKKLANILQQHNAKRDDIETVLKEHRPEVEAYQEGMIKFRFDLKGTMTREEWAKIFPVEKQPLSQKEKGQ